MISSRAILLFVAIVQILSVQRVNAEIELSICHEETFGGSNWQHISMIQLTSILKGGSEKLDLKIRRAVCNDSMPDTVCAAIPGKMFCRQSAFQRMNMVASWYAIQFVQGAYPDYESFRIAFDRPVKLAFGYADETVHADNVAAMQEPLRTFIDNQFQGIEQNNVSANLRRIAVIQNRIMAFNLASLVGHETYHINNEKCPVSTKSRMETSGLFQHILALQTSNDLFCASNPNPNEINADRCAARQVEALHSNPITDWEDDGVLETFAQRAASDMIAFQTLTGFRRFAQLPAGQYIIPGFDAYLNPVYRLVLLSSSVLTSIDKPVLCGDSASLFVHGVQTSFEQCGGDGEVSDELLSRVSPGVEDSWNGAPWTNKTISCTAE